jgi:hypothetical protein
MSRKLAYKIPIKMYSTTHFISILLLFGVTTQSTEYASQNDGTCYRMQHVSTTRSYFHCGFQG